jgi:hypothetical protein
VEPAPAEISTTDENDELISPNLTENGKNTFVGDNAGNSIGSTGTFNTFVGVEAGFKTSDGQSNTFVGHQAGHENNLTGYNTFLGYLAGYKNTQDFNTFIGSEAGFNNTSGLNNTFVGYWAGHSNRTDGFNTFVGYYAGRNNDGGEKNSFFGWKAGQSNTSGGYNTFVGSGAGSKNDAGYWNTFLGDVAGASNTGGFGNTFVGHTAGQNNTAGRYNTFVGYNAGIYNELGSNNVIIGYKAGYMASGSNKLYIDTLDPPKTKPLIYGDFSTRNVIIFGGFKSIASYSSSDGRWKKNIEPLESSLDKISSLQGVSYEWKTEEYPDVGMTEGKQIGLVAQEVEKVLPELVSEDKDGYKGVSYSKLTAVLVEAVKELKAENQSQKKLIEEQRNQFTKQQSEIEELRAMIKESKS